MEHDQDPDAPVVDTGTLLEQGEELLDSSRRLLADMEDVLRGDRRSADDRHDARNT